MVAGTRAFGLDETFIEPQVLNPPPTRHALLAFLIALAAVLHIGTAAWGDLYSRPDGQHAEGAREMIRAHQLLVATINDIPQPSQPPLLNWLLIASFKIFGVNAMAARLPSALAVIASVALTFLLGERLAGYCRGFAAGLILLCSFGTFLLGRLVMPEPVFTALVAAAMLCAVAGYERRRSRRTWFAGFWISCALACLTKGFAGILYPAGMCALLAIGFRQARLRFRALLFWPYLVLFALMVAPWFIWAEQHFPGTLREFGLSTSPSGSGNVPRFQFVATQLASWSPALILILPGLLFAWRKIFRTHEFEFSDAVPLCWIAVTMVPPFVFSERHDFSCMSAGPGIALFCALAWERMPRRYWLAGLSLVALLGAALAAGAIFLSMNSAVATDWSQPAARTTAWLALQATPRSVWLNFHPMIVAAAVALLVCVIAAVVLASRGRLYISLTVAIAGAIPLGLSAIEGVARVAPYFSFAEAARYVSPRLGAGGELFFEGPLEKATTLLFYGKQKCSLVNQPRSPFAASPAAAARYVAENDVLARWSETDPRFLIIEQSRIAHWREVVTERVHIYHQVATCGTYVVLSNQL